MAFVACIRQAVRLNLRFWGGAVQNAGMKPGCLFVEVLGVMGADSTMVRFWLRM